MESRAKLMGHAIHPMLVVFPLGLLATSVIFDLVYLGTEDTTFGVVSFWMIVAGIIGGLLAAVFGAIDWWAIPSGTRAKSVGLWHGIGNVAVVVMFTLSWYLRMNVPGHTPSTTAVTLSCVAAGLALVTGWLGGELVERLGVGVHDRAGLNAPSSLSQGPGSEGRAESPLRPGLRPH